MEAQTRNLVRPMDLPIYEACEAKSAEKQPAEPCAAQEAVKSVRLVVQDGFGQIREVKQQVDHIIETGKAHSEGTLNLMREEENLPMRLGFIGGGALFGYLAAIIRRKRFFGKSLYTLAAGGLFSAILYPEDAFQLGKDLSEEGQRLGKIGVNFIQGVTPQDVVKPSGNEDLLKTLSEEDKASLSNTSHKE